MGHFYALMMMLLFFKYVLKSNLEGTITARFIPNYGSKLVLNSPNVHH